MSRPLPRRATDLAIIGWLLLQIGLPLSYYLRGGGPDERFAWRMFTTERLTHCGVSLSELHAGEATAQDVDLLHVVQRGWISLLSRGQPEVSSALLDLRCTQPGVDVVSLRRRCTAPDGTKEAPIFDRRSCAP